MTLKVEVKHGMVTKFQPVSLGIEPIPSETGVLPNKLARISGLIRSTSSR